MKVFISWSGERSQALAQALRDWLPLVLHFVEPWLSQSDIDAGERWANEVAKELAASQFGIICVTRENIASPWILFEAGALAKSMQEGRVIPLLLGIEFKDIGGPLAQFQAKKVEKSGVVDVIAAINRFSESPIPEARLNDLFEALWLKLEQKILAIPKDPAAEKKNRPQAEVLEELVASVRGLDLRLRDDTDEYPRWRKRRQRFHPGVIDDMINSMDMEPTDPTRWLLMASFLKDDLPWIYEIAVDAYRASEQGSQQRAIESQRRFLSALRALIHGPFLNILEIEKDSYHMVHLLLRYLERHMRRDRKSRPSKSTLEPSDADKILKM